MTHPILQGAFLLLTLAVIGANLLADLLYFKLDRGCPDECVHPVAAAATEGVDAAAARRPGSIRHVALREPTAIAGLAIIAFFVLVALLSPILVTGDPKEKVGPIFGPPSASWPTSASTAAARTWSSS